MTMAGQAFGAWQRSEALDRIGLAAEDANIAEIGRPWPEWMHETGAVVAAENGWSADWLDDAVQFHLSPLADPVGDHLPL